MRKFVKKTTIKQNYNINTDFISVNYNL